MIAVSYGERSLTDERFANDQQMKPIHIAQIGCGYWGPNLLRSFSGLANCRVKFVVEQSVERQRYVQGGYPATRVTANLDEALNDPEVVAVIVATPARTHFEIARAALQAGKHVFVEKPLAMSVTEVDELAALADKAGLVLMVGHTFLYNPAVLYLKELLHRGELGEIYYAYSQRLNLGVIRRDVNAMWNLAPHDVSILCYLFNGAPESVCASGTAYIQPGIEDVVFMDLKFPARVQASVHVSWLDPHKIRRLTLVGSRKMVVYDDMADNKIAIYDKGIDQIAEEARMPFDSVSPTKLVNRSGDVLMPSIPSKEPLKEEAKHFLDCILHGKSPLTNAKHARLVVSVLEQGQMCLKRNESHAQAQPVVESTSR